MILKSETVLSAIFSVDFICTIKLNNTKQNDEIQRKTKPRPSVD
jgi:hypothetical protein